MFASNSMVILVTVLIVAVNGKFFVKNDTILDDKEKIFGGHDVQIQDYPYQVSVHAETMYCGGSIISPSHILTAAHCIDSYINDPSQVTVRSGTSYRDQGGLVSQVSQVICHDWYLRYLGHLNDIAILVLSEPLQFNNCTQKIQLIARAPQDKEEAFVSGWGLSSYWEKPLNLQATTVQVTTMAFWCGEGAGKVCTESSNGSSACKGDSGGPVTIEGRLAGLVSTMNLFGCGVPNAPELATSVYYHKDWILEKIGMKQTEQDLGMEEPGNVEIDWFDLAGKVVDFFGKLFE